MKWAKVTKMIKLDICNSSVNIEQPPNEMNIIAKECSSCGHTNVYFESKLTIDETVINQENLDIALSKLAIKKKLPT